jgi:hypothetical protein
MSQDEFLDINWPDDSRPLAIPSHFDLAFNSLSDSLPYFEYDDATQDLLDAIDDGLEKSYVPTLNDPMMLQTLFDPVAPSKSVPEARIAELPSGTLIDTSADENAPNACPARRLILPSSEVVSSKVVEKKKRTRINLKPPTGHNRRGRAGVLACAFCRKRNTKVRTITTQC